MKHFFRTLLHFCFCVAALTGCAGRAETPPEARGLWSPAAYRALAPNVQAIAVFRTVDAHQSLQPYASEDERLTQYERVYEQFEAVQKLYAVTPPRSRKQIQADLEPVMGEIGLANKRLLERTGIPPVPGQSESRDELVPVPAHSAVEWVTTGACMDEDLPAPRGGDVFQLIPSAQLIHPELLPLYQAFMRLLPRDETAQRYQQQIVWAMRGIGHPSVYAHSLGGAQRAVLNKSLPGGSAIFDALNERYGGADTMTGMLRGAFSGFWAFGSLLSDPFSVLNPEQAPLVANDQLASLVNAPITESHGNASFEYGQVFPGLYSHIVGIEPLRVRIRLVNTTSSDIDFDPTQYVAQAQRKTQRVSLSPPPHVATAALKVPDNDVNGPAEDKAFVESMMDQVGDLLTAYNVAE